MALGTSGDDVVAVQHRTRIGGRMDLVSAVAVVAFGLGRVTQLRGLAVIGIEVRFGDRFMALATLIHDPQLEVGDVGAGDGV